MAASPFLHIFSLKDYLELNLGNLLCLEKRSNTGTFWPVVRASQTKHKRPGMATLIESTSTTAALVDPYGGLHHRTSAIHHGTDDKCPPGGGDNGKLVAPKNKSSSPQRRHFLLAFQKNVRNNENNDNNDRNDDEDDERKGHPISSASPAAARRRVENNMAKIFSSLASFILLFPRSLWSQLYGPQNFNDYKAKINQQSSQSKRCRLLLMAVLVIIATITLLTRWRLVVGESDSHSTIQSSLLSSALQHCSSSSSSIQQLNQQQTTNSSNNIKSSLSSPSSSSSSSNKYILVASHLRAGSDGQLRLRIIEHNLRMLSYSTSSSSSSPRAQQYSSSSAPEEEDHATAATIVLAQGDNEEDLQLPKKKMECTLIFSLDENYDTTIRAMVQTWQNSMLSSSSNNNIISTSMNIAILYVPNDNIMVDASKWMIALYPLLPSIQLLQQDSRIMLMNDSFLLTRPTPELWNPTICGSVCGLVWTGPDDGSDPTRHIQSYIRTLDYCAVLRYMDFYERNKKMVHNVNELIVSFEINLDWAHQEPEGINGRGSSSWWSNSLLRGSSSSGKSNGGDVRKEDNNRDVTALYDYAGGHPDDEYAQHVLLTQNYPAIKLKKFFITDDPWLFAVLDKKDKANHNNITTTLSEEKEEVEEEEDLPPSFSTTIYRRTNHDLNHLSDNDLCKHFRTSGKYENRIYSNTLPLVMKGWLRIELERMMKEYDYIGVYNSQASEEEEDKWKGGGGVQRQADTTIAILDDYLVALNRDILGK